MPSSSDAPTCEAVTPSAASELGWIVDLLLGTAPYAVPALAELDDSLLPGITSLRESTREKSRRLWTDGLSGARSAGAPRWLPPRPGRWTAPAVVCQDHEPRAARLRASR